jgi:GTP-binding protein HflX
VNQGGHRPFILTDTVGFIRKLPHELVAAFRATLEELQVADVLVHVVDASHPLVDEHMEAVDRILGELEVAGRPTVVALNKVDRMEAGRGLDAQVARRDGVAISAVTGQGIPDLLKAIETTLPVDGAITLRIPHEDGAALARCYERGRVLARVDQSDHVVVDVQLPENRLGSLAGYRVLN